MLKECMINSNGDHEGVSFRPLSNLELEIKLKELICLLQDIMPHTATPSHQVDIQAKLEEIKNNLGPIGYSS